ncbi:MAG: VgrG-related protein [Acidimicrobiales bacterium]
MPDSRRVGVVVVTLNGGRLPVALYDDLIDVRVEQSVQLPDRFSLRFRDPDFDMLDAGTFSIGDSVDLAVDDGSAEVVVTHGEITSLAVDQGEGGRHELIVAGLDRAHRLARGPRVRTFLQATDAEVVRTIASDHGLRADTDATPVVHPYLLQAQTDFAFLTERAMAAGFNWWVDDTTLYFKSRQSAGTGPKLVFGGNLLRFRLRCSAAESASSVEVRAWDPERLQAIVGTASTTSPGGPGVALASDAPIATRQLQAASKSVAVGVKRGTGKIGVTSPKEADDLAASIGRQATSEQVTAKGEVVGDPKLRAGTEVSVSGVGQQLSGSYVLTSVEHVVGTSRGYITRFHCAGRRPGGLVDLLGPRVVEPWVATGPLIAIVTNTKDPERLGRVKVKYPTLSDSDESWWARVASVGAGPARGFQAGFEVGDEVLVAFEHGDLRRPIVLGGLWSTKQKPPRNVGAVDESTGALVSQMWRSHDGHVVELHDSKTPGESYVSVLHKDGKTKFRMGGDGVSIEAPTPVTITSDQGISVKAKGDLALEGLNVSITARAKVAVEGVSVAAKGKGQLQLEGAQAALKGSAMVSVEGGALAQVKGAIVKLN